jgi:hypothetical protein
MPADRRLNVDLRLHASGLGKENAAEHRSVGAGVVPHGKGAAPAKPPAAQWARAPHA